jgi:hypothetical protein
LRGGFGDSARHSADDRVLRTCRHNRVVQRIAITFRPGGRQRQRPGQLSF